MDASKKIEYGKLLLDLVPESGDNVGNVRLREQLREKIKGLGDDLTDEDYWFLRDSLIDEGLLEQGRGRGGSVHRVLSTAPLPDTIGGSATSRVSANGGAVEAAPGVRPEPSPESTPEKTEASLYEPFHNAILNGYTKDNRIKRFISELTAQQGRRLTGGKWTRPDLTLVAVRTYQFTPGKRIEVITFEVKPYLGDGALEGVYEALAQSAFAHRSYLAVDIREFKDKDNVPDDRIVQECTRHGIGYIAFTDVADYDTYEVVCSARLNEPDPYDVDSFVRTQISAQKQEELREFLQ